MLFLDAIHSSSYDILPASEVYTVHGGGYSI